MDEMQKMFERDWSPELVEKFADGRYKRTVVNAAWVQWQIAWAAGRESMREEAKLEAEQGIWFDKTGSEIADAIAKAIGKIKP